MAALIPELLRRHSVAQGDALALRVWRDGRWEVATWREFAELAAIVATRADAEFPCGRPVLVSVDNSVASLAAVAGLAAAGVDFALFEAESSLLADGRSVLHGLGADTVVGLAAAPKPYRGLPADELIRPAARRVVLADRASGNSAVWQLTSGFTGEPRLARQNVANLVRGGEIYANVYQITERDALLAAVPMAHSFGLVGGLMCALVSGTTLTTFTRLGTRGMREAVEAGATVILGTPLVYELVTRAVRPAASALRVALSSGGALDPGVALLAEERLGCPVYQVYGSTEMGIIASQFPSDSPWPAGDVGMAAPGVELRLTSTGIPGEEGAELFVRTSTMFGGYWGQAEPALDADGWYRTGDMAALDAAGHLRLVRRKDSFINVGGRKVNPARVERIIAANECVTEVAVYGVQTVGGQEVRAAVAFSAASTVESLIAYCRAHLAPYEVPYRVHVVTRLPRNGMGKIDRSQLPQ